MLACKNHWKLRLSLVLAHEIQLNLKPLLAIAHEEHQDLRLSLVLACEKLSNLKLFVVLNKLKKVFNFNFKIV